MYHGELSSSQIISQSREESKKQALAAKREKRKEKRKKKKEEQKRKLEEEEAKVKEVFYEMQDQKEDSAEGEKHLVCLYPDIIENAQLQFIFFLFFF